MEPVLYACYFPTVFGNPKHIWIWILWQTIWKIVSKHFFLRSPLLFALRSTAIWEKHRINKAGKRDSYNVFFPFIVQQFSCLLPKTVCLAFVYAFVSAFKILFLCFFLGCHPRHLISCKIVFLQVGLWFEDSLFTAGCSAVIIWVSYGLFLIFLFLSSMTTYK